MVPRVRAVAVAERRDGTGGVVNLLFSLIAIVSILGLVWGVPAVTDRWRNR